ncbi:MAG: hypothetical protein EF811_04955 [Methanonatronarchaeia archaeon]|nr:MAG: hypothetical protein EF811_04955 [Methanonatronarchaeia archaeon]
MSSDPSPPQIGETVSYFAELTDPDDDSTLEEVELELEYDGETVYQESKDMSGHSDSAEWIDVFVPDDTDKWLNASFTATDTEGDTTEEELNYFLEDTPPEISIEKPIDNDIYKNQLNYEFDVISNNDAVPDQEFNCDIEFDGDLVDNVSGSGDSSFSNSFYPDNEGKDLEFKISCTEDEYGGTAEETVKITYDNTEPEIDVVEPEEKVVYEKTNVPLQFSASSEITDVSCWFEIEEVHEGYECGDEVDVELDKVGNHTLEMFAEDEAGNIGSEVIDIETFFENKISVEDSETGYSIEGFEATFTDEETGDQLYRKETNESSLKFNTSELLEANSVELRIASKGYGTETINLDVDKTFELDQTFELNPAGLHMEIFDEQTNSEIKKPAEIMFMNSSKNSFYGFGAELIEFQATDSPENLNNHKSAWDGDPDTYFLVDGNAGYEMTGEVAITPGKNEIVIIGDTIDSDNYKYLDEVELETTGGTWETIKEDFSDEQKFVIEVEDGNSYTGKIRISGSYGGTHSDMEINNIYANNLNPPSKNYDELEVTGDIEIQVTDSGNNYPVRTYYTNIDRFSTVNLDTYLLQDTEGIYVQVEVYDRSGQFVENAETSVQKQFEGNWKTVDQKKTGSDGSSSFFLDPNANYKAIVNHPNYVAVDATFSPANYQYDALELVLSEDRDLGFFNMWDTISTKILPDNKTVYSEKQDFEFHVFDSDNELQAFMLKLKDGNNETIIQKSETGTPSGGTINITKNLTNYEGQEIEAVGEFIKNQTTYRYRRNYRVISRWDEGEYSLSRALTDLDNELTDLPKALIAIFIPLLFGVGLGRRIHRTGGSIVILMLLGIFTASGWINPQIFIITTLAGLGAIIWR